VPIGFQAAITRDLRAKYELTDQQRGVLITRVATTAWFHASAP
jgi:hypothetical protein